MIQKTTKKKKDSPLAVVVMQFIACLSREKNKNKKNKRRAADITLTSL